MTGRFTVDSDGDVEMSIPQPIFEVIKAPELSSWEHAALVEWHREWERYVEKMRHRCNTTGETYENVVATVKGSVRRQTLKNLATYVLKKPVASVTDEDIMAIVKTRCRTLKNEFVPDVTSLFRANLKMDLSIDDCDARIFRYYEDFNGIVEDNGLQGLMGADDKEDASYKNRMKARCKILIDNLQPTILKAQIDRLIELERRDCKTDDVALFDLILEHAKVQQRFHRMSQDHAVKTDSKASKTDRKPPRTAGSKPPTSRPAPSAPRASGAAATGAAASATPRAPPHDGCLVCKGSHWLNDCPTATDAQREEALRKYREDKTKKTGATRSKTARYAVAASTVRINGLVEMPYAPDTAADQSIVPQETLNSLRAMQPTLHVTKLPVAVEAVMANGQTQLCDEEVLLDLELTTVAGLVALRSVPCLVLAGDGDEFLLGREVLKGLGIDVEQQLSQLAGSPLLGDEVDEFPVGDELPSPLDTTPPIASQDQLLERAVSNGLPAEYVETVRELLAEFPDIWREAVGPDPPADVEPLRVTLRQDAVPYRSPPRKYAPLQAQFIREYVKSLVENNLVEPNNAARWACAVVPVRKPGTKDKFRLTIDYRPVNSVTVPIAGGMPTAASLLDAIENFQDKNVFGRVDFSHGFWQMPLAKESREMFSFITPDGVFTPNRVPQGAVDSALHFQSQVQTKLAPLIPHSAIVWVDDVLLFAPTVQEFMETLRTFFEIVHAAGFKLNMSKSSLFAVEMLWCGRLISGEGVRHDPARVDALATLPLPATVADLQYFVCATNWLHDSLPDYARVIAPLQDKLNAERSRIGRRNRNALNVATTWSDKERAEYNAVVALVADSALMTFPDADAELLLFTDASATGYGIVVTQVRDWDDSLPVDKQHHELVICKGGTFKQNELNWSVVEKEAFPIIKACQDLEYLLLRPKGFRLFCDHANLAYIFAPDVELKKHVRDRLQRWAMRLCGVHYTIEHISGEMNVWADIISRWHAREPVQVAAVQTRSHRVAPVSSLSPLRPLADKNFVFPSREDIKVAQSAAARERCRLTNFSEEEDGVVTINHRIWIPAAAQDLLARLFVIAHCGSQGHRGQEPMILALKDRFQIARLEAKVAKFVRECLLCKHFKGPRQIPRPYGPLMTPVRRNEIVHWDFLMLGEGFGDSSYLLVVKDGLSHFCELFPCATPTAYTAAEALTLWHARYGLPETLLSDQGTHFRNEMMKHLAARLKVELNFTPVYSPWLNGTVERLNKDVLQVVRALLMEYGLDTSEWPYLLPAVQASLNHTRVQSLAGCAPVEVFMGLPASSALDAIVVPTTSARSERIVNLDNVTEFVDQLRASLHALHREVTDVRQRQRLRDIAAHRGTAANFDVGDFVLWSRIDKRLPNHKLLGQWVGPFKVVTALPHSFEIQHLVTGRKYDVHASRLKFYSDADLNTTEELLELVSSQGMLLGVDKFVGHRYNSVLGRWELLVSWMGLQAIENSWEPLSVLLQDVPTKVADYVATTADDELRDQVE